MKNINSFFLLVLVSFFAFGIQACLDHDFDEPPIVMLEIPFAQQGTILELKSKYVPGKFTDITDDILLHAIVVADDKSGNYYKTLVVQDSTAGIEIKINRTGIYNNFPVGMKVGIKCKGLTIGAYNNLIQLGQGTTLDNSNRTALAGIEDVLLNQYVFGGPRNQFITPRKIKIGGLATPHLSTLIELEDVELDRGDVGKTYADAIGGNSVNLTITDCSGQKIIFRNSGFADFAGLVVSPDNGSLTGIFSVFGKDNQIMIRDINDIKFTKPSCNSGSNSEEVSIKSIRQQYLGSTTKVSQNKKIRGTVISNGLKANTQGQNLHIQDSSGGITIRFKSTHNFAQNDLLEIEISDQELSEFDGLLQVNSVPNGNAIKVGTSSINAVQKTIAEIVADFENLESSLVEVSGVQISKTSGNTYLGSCSINDGSGTMELFTRPQAIFANDVFPNGNVKITAIVTQGGSSKVKQLSIRNTDDVLGGGSGGMPILKTIKEIRQSYSGTTTKVGTNIKIQGIVISDKDNLNTQEKNLVIQDASGGIVVRFTANHAFSLHDEVEIVVSDMELSEFSTLLQINNVPNTNATKTGVGIVTPKLISIANIVADFENLESTLVQVDNVTISNATSSNWSGTSKIDDGTAAMDHFTRSQASFSGIPFPTTKVSLVGVVSQFNSSKQILIRNLNDVK